MAQTSGYTYGIRNALQQKGISGNQVGFNSKTGMVTIGGKDFIKPGTTSNGVANTTQAGFNTAWSSFNAPSQTPVMAAASAAAKAAQAAKTRVTNPAAAVMPKAAPVTAYNPVTPQQTTLDNINKAIQQQQQYQFKGPETPFSYDQTTDPAYQAQLAEAKRQAEITQLNTNAQLRGNGQGKSSYSEAVASQIGNNAITSLANNLVPQLMAQAYTQYNDTANRDIDVQKLNYGVGQDAVANLGNQYTYQNQEYFQNPITEAGLTGNYQSQAIKQAIKDINDLKVQTEGAGVTKDQRATNTAKADQIRAFLKSQGVDPTQFGANVSSKQTAKLQNVGARTIQGQQLDLQNKQTNIDTALRYGEQAGRLLTPQSDPSGYLRQVQKGAPLNLAGNNQQFNQAMDTRKQNFGEGLETRKQNFTESSFDRTQTFNEQSWATEFEQRVTEFGAQNALSWAAQYLNEAQLQEVIRSNQAGESIDAAKLAEMVRSNMVGEDQGWVGLDLDGQRIAAGGEGGASYDGLTQSQIIDSIKEQFARDVPVYDEDGDQTGTKSQYPKNKDAATKAAIYESVIAYGLPAGQEDQTLLALGLTQKDIAELDKQYADAAATIPSGGGGGGGGPKPNTAQQASFKPGSNGLTFTNGTSGYNNYYKAQKFVGTNNFNQSGAAVAQAIKNAGYPGEWLAPALELVARESSFNPNAANPDSTARGLFQFLDGTRRDYGGSKVNWSDPYEQAKAGLKYIKDRYGTPTKALQFWDKNSYY